MFRPIPIRLPQVFAVDQTTVAMTFLLGIFEAPNTQS
jgi:hypothetical protein